MHVIRITKKSRNNSNIHYIIVNSMDPENVHEYVLDFCENEPCGKIYGYSFEWEEEKDPDIIKSVIEKEINISISRLNYINENISLLKSFLNNF